MVQVAQVQSLVRELRPCELHTTAKKQNKTPKQFTEKSYNSLNAGAEGPVLGNLFWIEVYLSWSQA